MIQTNEVNSEQKENVIDCVERKVRKRIQDALIVCPNKRINTNTIPQPEQKGLENFARL